MHRFTGPVRAAAAALGVLTLAGALVLAAGALAPAGRPTAPDGPRPDLAAARLDPGADPAAAVGLLQARLRRLPGDWSAWARLGTLYVDLARTGADPSLHVRAEQALRRSLEVRPDDNPAAVTGLAALAAARHDFAAARRHATAALRLAPYDTTALGVLTDALVELGHYPAATRSLQRMLDLDPGIPALTRAGYLLELRGDVAAARAAIQRAARLARSPGDVAYTHQQLGDLAFSQGALGTAARWYAAGLRRVPGTPALLAGQARVLAAQGRVDAALRRWAEVVARQASPDYLAEYGDLLAAAGRSVQARRQFALVRATQQLYRAAGTRVDLDLARFDAEHGRPGAAVAAARAEWQRRRSVEVADTYAWALHAVGRDRAALALADRAARLGTRSAAYAYHRGMIERALGQDAAARRSLRRALEINPYFSPRHAPLAARALAALGGAR